MKRLPIVYDDRSNKSYWRSLDEQQNAPSFADNLAREFPEGTAEMSPDEGEFTRRNFLTVMGASIALAGGDNDFGGTGSGSSSSSSSSESSRWRPTAALLSPSGASSSSSRSSATLTNV